MITKNLIYALKDPETKQIRYVGKSTKGLKRPNEHKRKHSLLANNHKNNWIKSLINKGLIYEVLILEEDISTEELNDKEKHWVAHYKAMGASLTNQTDGGEGTWGYKMKEETKQIMSEKRKSWYKEVGPSEIMKRTCFKRKENPIIDGAIKRDCTDCKLFKNLEDFAKNKHRYDGLATVCKTCQILRAEEYRKTHAGPLLTPEELAKSYDDRKEAMRAGVIQAYKDNPDIKRKISEKTSKPILQCEINTGKVIKEFASALEAKQAGFQNSNIGQAIKFKRSYRGFTWKFKNSK